MYIRTLYELAEHCQFGATRDEHIRDRLVIGIADKELSRQFQLKADLTLAQVIERVRQTRQVNLQTNRPDAQLANVNTVKGKVGQYRKKGQRRESGRCGKPQHSDERHCPALKSKCNKSQGRTLGT